MDLVGGVGEAFADARKQTLVVLPRTDPVHVDPIGIDVFQKLGDDRLVSIFVRQAEELVPVQPDHDGLNTEVAEHLRVQTSRVIGIQEDLSRLTATCDQLSTTGQANLGACTCGVRAQGDPGIATSRVHDIVAIGERRLHQNGSDPITEFLDHRFRESGTGRGLDGIVGEHRGCQDRHVPEGFVVQTI